MCGIIAVLRRPSTRSSRASRTSWFIRVSFKLSFIRGLEDA